MIAARLPPALAWRSVRDGANYGRNAHEVCDNEVRERQAELFFDLQHQFHVPKRIPTRRIPHAQLALSFFGREAKRPANNFSDPRFYSCFADRHVIHLLFSNIDSQESLNLAQQLENSRGDNPARANEDISDGAPEKVAGDSFNLKPLQVSPLPVPDEATESNAVHQPEDYPVPVQSVPQPDKGKYNERVQVKIRFALPPSSVEQVIPKDGRGAHIPVRPEFRNIEATERHIETRRQHDAPHQRQAFHELVIAAPQQQEAPRRNAERINELGPYGQALASAGVHRCVQFDQRHPATDLPCCRKQLEQPCP